MRRKKIVPGDAHRDPTVLTPLERELLDGLAELIAADILRVRAHEPAADRDVHEPAPKVASC